MTASPPNRLWDALASTFGSTELARALTTSSIATMFLSSALRALIGWAGLLGIVVVLCALAAASLAARRGTLEWRGLLTVSLLAFVGWCALSLLWSDYQWATLTSVLYQLAVALLGVYIALVRDLIQVVRTFGDVLRALLVTSLAIEVVVGILLDTSAPFLGITGGLESGGPVQGLFGTRNALGLVALLALVTFIVEALTRSVVRGVSIPSLALAGLCLVLSRSPVTLGTAVVLALAGLVLLLLRRLTVERRRIGHILAGIVVALALLVAWSLRSPIIDLLNAGSEFEYRYEIWKRVLGAVALNPIEGFGWLGYWRADLPPYINIDVSLGGHPSALNSYLDTLLQVGAVGLALLLVLLGLAVVRSWVLAANRRSVVYVWPALIVITLAVTSAAESTMLVEYGWLLLVIVAVRGSEGLSWRRGLQETVTSGADLSDR